MECIYHVIREPECTENKSNTQDKCKMHYDENRILRDSLREELEMLNIQYDMDSYLFDKELIQRLVHSKELTHHKQLLTQLADVEATLSSFKRAMTRKRNIRTESASVLDTSDRTINVEENLQDEYGEVMPEEKVGRTETVNIGQKETLAIANVFSRPVLVGEYSITPGTEDNKVFKIWDLLSMNPVNRAKMRNYAYFKGKIRLSVNVSGTPQHFGCLMASYQPFPTRNDNLVNYVTLIAAVPAARQNLLAYLSQSPQVRFLEVNDNAPAILDIPFISMNGMFRLYNGSAVISDVTSFQDFDEAGSLYCYTATPVECISATPSDVYVRIYAQFYDVELGAPTATQVGITTESASELVTGPVEPVPVRSWSATFGRYVAAIPKLASATSLAFQGLGSIAALLGFSKPQVIQPPNYVKNEPYRNGANVIGSYTGKKLTLDPKQELSIDPRIIGVDYDELSLQNICSIKSLLTNFTWTIAQTPASPIFNARVTPDIATFTLAVANTYVQPTPMGLAASTCGYWHGDITFTFKVIASKFHRGKLQVYYEPNYDQNALIDASIALNKQYSVIIDLQSTRTAQITVKWAQHRGFSRVLFPGYSEYLYGALFGTNVKPWFSNGYIGVAPFTELQSPDGSSVKVMVFVHSDNMTLAVPTNQNLPRNRIVTESASEELKTNTDLVVTINATHDDVSALPHHYFGETLTSFRAYIKRFATVHTATHAVGLAADVAYEITYPCVPPPAPAYGSSAITELNPMQYIRYAFLGLRGSVRQRLAFYNEDNMLGDMSRAVVHMEGITVNNAYVSGWVTNHPKAKIDASVAFVPATNGGIEFETPYFSPNLFSFSFSLGDVGNDNSENEMLTEWYRKFKAIVPADSTKTIVLNLDSAGGEDFTFFRFSGAPFHSY